MITSENFRDVLDKLGFKEPKKDFYIKEYHNNGNVVMSVDFKKQELQYPQDIQAARDTTKNFSQNENFVVFECVDRLLTLGYKARHITLEKAMPGGHHSTPGYCDIIITDNDEKTFLIVECKTSDEFDYFWEKTKIDGGQLFNYYNSFRQAKALCLYESDLSDNNKVIRRSNIISMEDNESLLANNLTVKSFKKIQEENGNKDDYFDVWKDTYHCDYEKTGIFEEDMEPYTVKKKKVTVDDLIEVDNNTIQKKYNEFATILRQHNVGSHENAFDKLVNLYLAKIVDESTSDDELMFRWRGAASDDYYSMQDRLQKLYKDGMEKFLGEEVTYVDQNEINAAFHLFKNDPDATKEKVLEYFRKLKFFTNNDFAFLDVHNERLFNENAAVLKKMVQMLQDIKLKSKEHNQFLGDLFEGFLDDGVKQSEGQFFTPMPIVKFMVYSLPIEQLILNSENPPLAIDYACGAGHFLTEYASYVDKIIRKMQSDKIPYSEYIGNIYGVEKEYRLSKVAKVSSFMYGFDDIKIVYGDALLHDSRLKDNKFSVLMANPPYTVKGFLETLPEKDRKKFTLYHKVAEVSKNDNIETFFVERAKQLLKDDGIAAIVLPSTILTNGSIDIYCREIILKSFEIIAIASFGEATFSKTGTNTIALFLRKKDSNPDMALHCKNRVDAWFSVDDSKNVVFEDKCVLEDYCNRCDIDYIEYCKWLSGDDFPSANIFSLYVEDAKKSADYKRIQKKKIRKNYAEDDKKEELKCCINSYVKKLEKEKLYYYMLAHDNRPVVLVKCPAKTQEMKNFLGYEWSGAKNNEGIHYLGTTISDEENTIEKNRGINSINTPMYNPDDYDDKKKINMIIRANYLCEEIAIPEELEAFVSIGDLTYMMEFGLRKFDKSIKTFIPKKIKIESNFEVEPLSKLVTHIGGLWTGKKPPFKKISVIRNTNFTKNGQLDLSDVATVDVSEKQYSTRNLKPGDILLEKSGGSNTQAVGRVVLISNQIGLNYSFSNFTARLRINRKDIKPKYLHIILNQYYLRGYTFEMQTGSSGIKNLNMDSYFMLPIPIPSLAVQELVIERCAKVDEEFEMIRMSNKEYKDRIDDICAELGVMKKI